VIDLRATAEIKAKPDPVITGVTEENVSIVDETSPGYLTAASFVPTDDPVANAIALVENGTFSDTMYSYIVTDTYGQNGFHEFFEKLLAMKTGQFCSTVTPARIVRAWQPFYSSPLWVSTGTRL